MKTYKNVHIQQHDQSDCGVACLASILKYYGGEAPLERIREWSGTSASGTTLLGLLQAAQKLKLDAEGFEAEVKHLRELENPAILHVIKNQELPHFIICYQYQEANDSFLISDPAEPYIQELSAEAIDRMWVTKTLLLVKPTDQIRQKGPATNRNRLKWVFDFTRPDLNLLLSSLVLGLIVSILSLSVAVFSQKLVDVILPSQNLGKLIAGAALLLFLLLVRSLVGYLRQVFLTTQSRAFNIRILDYFYNKLLFLPKPFFDNRKTGDLVARMNDTARIQETISILFSSLAIDLIMVVVSSVALLFYSLSIGLLSLIWIPLFGLIVWRFSKQVIHRQRGVMVGYAMNESNYIDTIQGVGVIKVKGREKVFESLTRRIYTLFQEARYQLGLTGIRFGISAQVAGSIFMVGMIVYSSWLVMEGHLTVGGVMAVIQLLGLSMASVATIANAYINLQEARIALDRMREFTELEPEYDPEEEGQKQALPAFERLSVQGLDFRFTGRPLLLENISFDLQKGEMIALMGESGCGKSTLLQILQGFLEPAKGKIKVNGQDIGQYNLRDWRKILGVVPQEIQLFNASIAENIALAAYEEIDQDEVGSFLKSYGLEQPFLSMPAGLDTVVGESGINLSGGQLQLLGIARALYHQPQLLLLDEATAAMDRATEKQILNLLQRLKKEMGVFLVTHRIQSASMADRIYLLDQGTILAKGTHEELMKGDNFYRTSILELAGLAG